MVGLAEQIGDLSGCSSDREERLPVGRFGT